MNGKRRIRRLPRLAILPMLMGLASTAGGLAQPSGLASAALASSVISPAQPDGRVWLVFDPGAPEYTKCAESRAEQAEQCLGLEGKPGTGKSLAECDALAKACAIQNKCAGASQSNDKRGTVAPAATCQQWSDAYAIVAGKGFGFSPADVRTSWTAQNCNVNPSPMRVAALCQQMSDKFQIVAGKSFGSADADVQGSWKALNCNTNPR
jgi:hypothetical protein